MESTNKSTIFDFSHLSVSKAQINSKLGKPETSPFNREKKLIESDKKNHPFELSGIESDRSEAVSKFPGDSYFVSLCNLKLIKKAENKKKLPNYNEILDSLLEKSDKHNDNEVINQLEIRSKMKGSLDRVMDNIGSSARRMRSVNIKSSLIAKESDDKMRERWNEKKARMPSPSLIFLEQFRNNWKEKKTNREAEIRNYKKSVYLTRFCPERQT